MKPKKVRGSDRTPPATSVLHVRLTEAERKEIERRAKARKMLLSEYVRAVAQGR